DPAELAADETRRYVFRDLARDFGEIRATLDALARTLSRRKRGLVGRILVDLKQDMPCEALLDRLEARAILVVVRTELCLADVDRLRNVRERQFDVLEIDGLGGLVVGGVRFVVRLDLGVVGLNAVEEVVDRERREADLAALP